ncbi:MAG TPA: hypothetical protein QF556_00630, partial [Rhodospirillales bacterium]|nr:hypothetical protein [Rhodospirillales bacterium]
NPKGEHGGVGFAVQVDDTHKMAISLLKQYVADSHLGFYGTVVMAVLGMGLEKLVGTALEIRMLIAHDT